MLVFRLRVESISPGLFWPRITTLDLSIVVSLNSDPRACVSKFEKQNGNLQDDEGSSRLHMCAVR